MYKLSILFIAFVIYGIAFVLFYRFWEGATGIGYFFLIPLIAVSIVFGLKGGIVAGVLAHPINLFFQFVLGTHIGPEHFQTQPIIGWGSALVIGISVGYMRDISARYKHTVQKLKKSNEELNYALEEIKTLGGLIPICSGCKKIRDDEGYWQQVEIYIEKRSEARFSHSLCPGCIRKLYPEYKNNVDSLDD